MCLELPRLCPSQPQGPTLRRPERRRCQAGTSAQRGCEQMDREIPTMGAGLAERGPVTQRCAKAGEPAQAPERRGWILSNDGFARAYQPRPRLIIPRWRDRWFKSNPCTQFRTLPLLGRRSALAGYATCRRVAVPRWHFDVSWAQTNGRRVQAEAPSGKRWAKYTEVANWSRASGHFVSGGGGEADLKANGSCTRVATGLPCC